MQRINYLYLSLEAQMRYSMGNWRHSSGSSKIEKKHKRDAQRRPLSFSTDRPSVSRRKTLSVARVGYKGKL